MDDDKIIPFDQSRRQPKEPEKEPEPMTPQQVDHFFFLLKNIHKTPIKPLK